jgi:hypothetical protein
MKSIFSKIKKFCPFGQMFSAFALPQATLRSSAVMEIKPVRAIGMHILSDNKKQN